MKLPIALQLYSIRDVTEKDFAAALRETKKLGYDGVEYAGFLGFSPDEVRKMTEDAGLVPLSAHVPYYDMLKEPDKVMSDTAAAGCRFIAVPYLTPERRPGTDGFDETVRGIDKIAKAAKKAGLILLYHNHDFEFVRINGEYALDFLYRSIPSDLLMTEIDTCWVNVGGENPAKYIEKYTGRAPVVHLKDFVSAGKGGKMYKLIGIDDNDDDEGASGFEFRPVGYGCQDFNSIIKASENAKSEWLVVEQDEPSMGKSTLECAKMSIEWLRKTAG